MKKQLWFAIVSSTSYTPPWSEGVRNLMRKLAQDMKRRKAQVTIVVPKADNSPVREDDKIDVIEISSLLERKGTNKWITILAHLFLWFKTSWILRGLKSDLDALIVIASLSSAIGFRITLLKLTVNKPILLYITGLSSPRIGYNWGIKADRVFVGNDFLKKWYPNAEILPPFLPVNVNPLNIICQNELEKPFNVAFLGSFEPGRGVEILLQAFAQVINRTNHPVKLTIAWNGAGNDNHESIQNLIDDLGVRKLIALKGHVDTTDFYLDADVVVIPRETQKYMAFPVRIIEALNLGTPLIVTRICGMEDLIKGCGLCVEPGHIGELADAILKLVNDQSLLQGFKENCKIAKKQFDSEVTLDRVYRALKEVKNG